MSVREKIEAWVSENPDDYLQKTLKQMAKEIGVSAGSVDRYLPEIIAERDGCMPSDVIDRRKSEGYNRRGPRLTPNEIEKIHEYAYVGMPSRDIAYMLGRGPKTIEKYMIKHNLLTDEDG